MPWWVIHSSSNSLPVRPPVRVLLIFPPTISWRFFCLFFSLHRVTAAAKAALDVVTYRLTRPDRPKSAAGASIIAPPITDPENGGTNGTGDVNDQGARSDSQSRLRVDAESAASVAIQEVEDAPMEVLGDAGVILAAMKAHPMDARLQESGWRSLIAMDTGRGDVDRFLTGGGGGDGQRSRRQMLKDCLERHGGDSMVAGQVAAILEGLVLHGGDSGVARPPNECRAIVLCFDLIGLLLGGESPCGCV